tara:strand:+ start:12 stop:557 length:546 start_codon:yes stop_codon:yes gene_type:complete
LIDEGVRKVHRYLLSPLLFSSLLPVQADENCLFISQYEPDLTIEVGTKGDSNTKGFIKYKGSPVFSFSTGVRNGYGGQYFSISTVSNSSPAKVMKIVSGSVITIVGDQSGTGTPKEKRIPGLNKIFFPNFGLNYWYSIDLDKKKSDDLFKSRTEKVNSIFRASEGFWIPSEICKKYVYYGW